MKLIKHEEFNRKLKEGFNYKFEIEKEGLYLIEISARARSEKQIDQNGTDDDDLRIEIDGRKFPKLENPERYSDSPASFSGGQLHNLKKTVYFLIFFSEGKHFLDFIPDKTPVLENLSVYFIGQNIKSIKSSAFDINQRAEDGDRRSWITFALVDLSLKQIKAEATTKWRFLDSDDVKLIIDGKIQKPEEFFSKWRNWLWSGSIFKKLFQKETQTKTIESNLSKGLHYIEFHADKTPILHNVKFNFGEELNFRTKARVVWDYTRLRKEPNIKSEAIIERINEGRQVIILEKAIKGERFRNETNNKLLPTNRWHKVEYQNKVGYIYSLALEVEGENKENIQKIIIEKAKNFDLNPEILLSLAQCESTFFPYTVSFDEKNPEVAFGIMQLSEILLKDLNDKTKQFYNPVEDVFDIEQNIQGGISYFKYLYDVKYKDDKDRLRKSVAAYNAGPGTVEVDNPLELELYDSETQRIASCVQNHLKKKVFKNFLKSLPKIGFVLFLSFQLLLFFEALSEPKNEIIFYSNVHSTTSFTEKKNLDAKLQNSFDNNEELIDPDCMTSEGYMGEEFCRRYKEWAGWE